MSIARNIFTVRASIRCPERAMEGENNDLYQSIWGEGYSIAELWGHAAAPTRATSDIDADHLLLWGILSIVEYQVDKGAGHRYLRDRLASGDWIALGYRAPKTSSSRLVRVPQFDDAQFGRKRSAIGTAVVEYHDVRIVHRRFFADNGGDTENTS